MASAQVLPSLRKQEHLEAGKRRLEEFRKKKAAERAKKAATINQPNASDVILDHKKSLETEHVRLTDSDGADTSDGLGRTVEPFSVPINYGNSAIEISKEVEQSSLKGADPNSSLTSKYSTTIPVPEHGRTNSLDSKRYEASGFANAYSGQEKYEANNDHGINIGNAGELPYGISSDHSSGPRSQPSLDFDSISRQSSGYGMDSLHLKGNNVSLIDSIVVNHDSRFSSTPQNSATSYGQTTPSNAISLIKDVDSIQHSINGPVNSDFGESNSSILRSHLSAVNGADGQTYEPAIYGSDVNSFLNQSSLYSFPSEANPRRSRPSFLDSLNVSSSGNSFFKHTGPEQESFMPSTSKPYGLDVLGSSVFQKPMFETETMGLSSKTSTTSVYDHKPKFPNSSSNGVDPLRSNFNMSSMDNKHDFFSSKQNEDFAALEQHIEDLTQEKFSLQRALEASRALAESLAGENSSLTDSYNQQRSVVNQLKLDMESLQEEIKSHLVELEAVKIEFGNAQLECSAADERAKLLASEVIGLEDKALRLRSNELKLERELENTQAEINSYKKKMSSLEKDRQDLQSTIDALQEEKKLLQSKLRKASAGGKVFDAGRSPANKKDMSTSTEDLDTMPGTSNQEAQHATSVPGSDTPGYPMLSDNGHLNLDVASVYIPPDQMFMIQNINTLISELALEKEDLLRALASESFQCSKLKDLNNEFSRKLELQTKRLELLTAQSMANENGPARLPDSRTMQESAAPYADEGDEVVERVLGWIMKLFPGGPSRRRTSKLL